jgi:chromosome segregation ATPase
MENQQDRQEEYVQYLYGIIESYKQKLNESELQCKKYANKLKNAEKLCDKKEEFILYQEAQLTESMDTINKLKQRISTLSKNTMSDPITPTTITSGTAEASGSGAGDDDNEERTGRPPIILTDRRRSRSRSLPELITMDLWAITELAFTIDNSASELHSYAIGHRHAGNVDTLNTLLNKIEKATRLIRDKHLNREGEVDNFKNEIDRLTQSLQDTNKEIDRLNQTLHDTNTEKDNVLNRIKELENEIDGLRNENNQLDTENDRIGDENDKIRNERDELRNERNRLRDENNNLKDERDKLRDDLNNMTTESQRLENNCDMLLNAARQTEVDNNELRIQLRQCNNRHNIINRDREYLRGEIRRKDNIIDRLDVRLGACHRLITRLTQQYTRQIELTNTLRNAPPQINQLWLLL